MTNAPQTPARFGQMSPRLGALIVALWTLMAVVGVWWCVTRTRAAGYRGGCTNWLRQIAVALRLYQQDHGAFPLDATEAPPTRFWYGADRIHGGGRGLAALYHDYIGVDYQYTCPSDRTRVDDPDFPSYNIEDPAKTGVDRLKYRRVWQRSGAGPDPSERRQLIWPDAPGDTVVTWCHLHRRDPHGTRLRRSDRDLVLFLDQRVESVPSRETGHAYRPSPDTR